MSDARGFMAPHEALPRILPRNSDGVEVEVGDDLLKETFKDVESALYDRRWPWSPKQRNAWVARSFWRSLFCPHYAYGVTGFHMMTRRATPGSIGFAKHHHGAVCTRCGKILKEKEYEPSHY